MGLYDNPSADRFGPPPGSSDPQPTSTGPKPIPRLALVALVLIGLKYLVRSYEARSFLGAITSLALMWAAAWIGHKRAEEKGHSPYSSNQHLTR